jgi:hypothetical protein
MAAPGPLAALVPVRRVRAWPGESVGQILDRAPTRFAYGLVVVDVDDQAGSVAVGTEELFPPGLKVVAGAPATTEATVVAPPEEAELLLVVVATPPGPPGDPQSWRLVGAARCPSQPSAPARVRVVLDGPGRVRFVQPAGARPVDAQRDGRAEDLHAVWTSALERLPTAYGTRLTDLVLLVELGGHPAERAGARLRLAEELLTLLAREHPEPTTVQATVIGYADHDLRADRRHEPVLRRVDAVAPADAAAAVAAWKPAAVFSEDLAAPLEDALRAATDLRWRPAARAVLITIAARAPHAPRLTDQLTSPCPFRADWEKDMEQLAGLVGPTRVAVVELDAAPSQREPQDEEWAERAWRALGADGLLAAPADARSVACRARLLGDDGRPVPDGSPGTGRGSAEGTPRRPLTVPMRAAGRAEGVR